MQRIGHGKVIDGGGVDLIVVLIVVRSCWLKIRNDNVGGGGHQIRCGRIEKKKEPNDNEWEPRRSCRQICCGRIEKKKGTK